LTPSAYRVILNLMEQVTLNDIRQPGQGRRNGGAGPYPGRFDDAQIIAGQGTIGLEIMEGNRSQG